MTFLQKKIDNQPKIIHLISSLTRGGRERQLALIVSNTDSNIYPTRILFFNEVAKNYIDEYNLVNSILQIQSKGKLARLLELHKVFKKEKPSIVYSWGFGESFAALILNPFHKYFLINGSIRHGIRSKRISHYFRSLILHLSKNIVANSKSGLRANNLHRGYVLYNGVDPKFLEPFCNRAIIRKQLSKTTETTPLIISLANLVPYKDYHTIILALEQLYKESYSFRYLILGRGPMHQQIKNVIEQKGLSEHITLVGSVENVSAYLNISDMFIHSSKGEGCSNAILEAMAAGLPIIASDTGGTSELVNNSNGYLFEYKNQRVLYDQIKNLLENKTIRETLGKNSKLNILASFSVETMMKKYYQIIDSVLSH